MRPSRWIAQRRWRAVAVWVGVIALSLPLWPDFLASFDTVASSLDAQAVGLSAWAAAELGRCPS